MTSRTEVMMGKDFPEQKRAVARVTSSCGAREGNLGRTKQEFKEECDINEVLRRWTKTRELPPPRAALRYGDFTQVTDYHEAMSAVTDAETAFNELPAHMRTRFNNDPGELLDFLGEPSNLDEAVELGLVTTAETEAETPPPPVVETPPPIADPVAGGE